MPRLFATLALLPALLGLAPAAAAVVHVAETGEVVGAVGTRGDMGVDPAGGVSASESGGSSRPTVVVLGAAGLRWSDIDAEATPSLWAFQKASAIGSLVTRSVRTTSCPADGWLALGAGNRAGDAEPEDACRPLTDPGPDGAVPRWDVFTAERDAAAYGSQLGLLGDLLAEHGHPALAIGPGAAIALASSRGTVDRFETLPDAPDELGALLEEGRRENVVVVDLGTVSDDAPEARAAQVASVTARADAALEALAQTDAAVMLVSLADAGPEPRLQVLALHGFPGSGPDASTETLRSSSTRQPGYVLATDLLPTVLEALGLADAAPPGALVGAPARGTTAGGDDVAAMIDLDRHSSAIRALTPGFFALLIIMNIALYAAVWLRGLRPAGGFRVLGVVVGAVPVATFLANLVPWWRAGGAGLYLAVLGAVALVAGLALLGPWRRSALGPLTVVAAVTAVTIVLDVLSGSRLQLGSPMGVHPLVAGRFYGLNNSAFALLMVSSLLVAAVLGSALVARGRRAWGVGVVAAVGVVVTVVDGMPGLGSDFGGPPALVPAFAVLALLVAGVRVGWRRVALVLGAGIVVVSAFAIADWVRPEASRTHLGRFVQTVLDGGLLDVIVRKAGQNLTILTSSWLIVLVGAGVALVVWLVGRPRGAGLGSRAGDPSTSARGRGLLRAARDDIPALRVVLPAATAGLAIGFAVNDSGIVIPAIGFSLAVPLVISTLAAWHAVRVAQAPSESPRA